jgi:hypothetical protein
MRLECRFRKHPCSNFPRTIQYLHWMNASQSKGVARAPFPLSPGMGSCVTSDAEERAKKPESFLLSSNDPSALSPRIFVPIDIGNWRRPHISRWSKRVQVRATPCRKPDAKTEDESLRTRATTLLRQPNVSSDGIARCVVDIIYRTLI